MVHASWARSVLAAGLLLVLPRIAAAEETWLKQLQTASGLYNEALLIHDAAPAPDGWYLAVASDAYSVPPEETFQAIVKVDLHGNLQWTLENTGKMEIRQGVFPLAGGNLLYPFYASPVCATFWEISPRGEVTSRGGLTFDPRIVAQRPSGSVVLVSAAQVLQRSRDLSRGDMEHLPLSRRMGPLSRGVVTYR